MLFVKHGSVFSSVVANDPFVGHVRWSCPTCLQWSVPHVIAEMPQVMADECSHNVHTATLGTLFKVECGLRRGADAVEQIWVYGNSFS